MSDKNNIPLQDRGWNEMASILDKEMPVNKKKRRLLPWFLMLGLLLGLGAIFLNESLNKMGDKLEIHSQLEVGEHVEIEEVHDANERKELDKEENINTVQNSNQLTNNQIQSGSDNSNNLNGSIQKNTNENSPLEASSTKQNISNRTNSKESEHTQNSTFLEKVKLKESQRSALEEFSLTSSLRTEGETPHVVFFDEKILTSNQEVNSLESEEKTEDYDGTPSNEPNDLFSDKEGKQARDAESNLFKLPQLDMGYLHRLQIENVVIHDPIIIAKRSTAITPYIFVAGNYQANVGGKGYEFGAGLDISRNKLGMYFEVGYSRSAFDNTMISSSSAPEGSVTELDDEIVVDNGSVSGMEPLFSVELNNFSKLISSTKSITFAFGVNYQLTKRLRLDAGVGYSKLLNATNKTLVLQYTPVETSFEQEPFLVNVANSELYEGGAYASYDILPHFGMEYNLFSNAYLSINYHYGMRNFIVNQSVERADRNTKYLNSEAAGETFYRRYFEAKVRYLF